MQPLLARSFISCFFMFYVRFCISRYNFSLIFRALYHINEFIEARSFKISFAWFKAFSKHFCWLPFFMKEWVFHEGCTSGRWPLQLGFIWGAVSSLCSVQGRLIAYMTLPLHIINKPSKWENRKNYDKDLNFIKKNNRM